MPKKKIISNRYKVYGFLIIALGVLGIIVTILSVTGKDSLDIRQKAYYPKPSPPGSRTRQSPLPFATPSAKERSSPQPAQFGGGDRLVPIPTTKPRRY